MRQARSQTADLIGHTAASAATAGRESAQRPPPLRLQTLTQTQMRPCDLQIDDSCACFLLSLFAFLLSSLYSVRPSLQICLRLCASSSPLCGLACRFFAVSRFVIPLGCAHKLIIFDLRKGHRADSDIPAEAGIFG